MYRVVSGGGPSQLPAQYHTVIELPRKRGAAKRSPLGWKSLFGKSGRKTSVRKMVTAEQMGALKVGPSEVVFVFTSLHRRSLGLERLNRVTPPVWQQVVSYRHYTNSTSFKCKFKKKIQMI